MANVLSLSAAGGWGGGGERAADRKREKKKKRGWWARGQRGQPRCRVQKKGREWGARCCTHRAARRAARRHSCNGTQSITARTHPVAVVGQPAAADGPPPRGPCRPSIVGGPTTGVSVVVAGSAESMVAVCGGLRWHVGRPESTADGHVTGQWITPRRLHIPNGIVDRIVAGWRPGGGGLMPVEPGGTRPCKRPATCRKGCVRDPPPCANPPPPPALPPSTTCRSTQVLSASRHRARPSCGSHSRCRRVPRRDG